MKATKRAGFVFTTSEIRMLSGEFAVNNNDNDNDQDTGKVAYKKVTLRNGMKNYCFFFFHFLFVTLSYLDNYADKYVLVLLTFHVKTINVLYYSFLLQYLLL